jgi:predicted 3-demethylubiquinone-9 3-methyltransferase (glyoxalase superfamily)
MQTITPFLWFNGNAEKAVKFYLSVFKGSKILDVLRNTTSSPGKTGSVLTIKFMLLGQEFVAINGGSRFPFTQAVSFVVRCRNQKEVDYYWKKLTAGGKEIQCGWLSDKFGLIWQVTPEILLKLIASRDPKKADRVMRAMMSMVKIDIARIQQAARRK